MPQPTGRDLYINKALGDVSVAFQQNTDEYIADRVFPNVPVQQQGGVFYKYDKDDWFRSIAGKRAPASESPGGGWTVTTDDYFCHVYAAHKDIDEQDLANADSQFNLDRDATLWTTGQLLLKREQIFASTYLTTGVWGRDLTGVAGTPSTNQFKQFDASGSDPVQTIRSAAITSQKANGIRLNTLVMGPSVMFTLEQHSLILDRIKYTERGIVTEDLLRALFRVDRIFVTNAIQNTAAKGATAALSFITDNSMLLCYTPPNPGLLTPSAGYTFSWNGLLGASALGTSIARIPVPLEKSTRIEGEMAWDMEVIASELGVYFGSVVGTPA